MKVKIDALESNPHRDLDEYPIQRERINSLKASIEDTSFWDNILARPHPTKKGKFQIAYGHHRLLALQETKLTTVDIPVRDLDDGMMLKIMANENRDVYGSSHAVMVETIKKAREYLKEQSNKNWSELDASVRFVFGGNKQTFSASQTKGIGHQTIKTFLNGDWKKWEIQAALGELDDKEVDKEVLKPIKSAAKADVTRKALRKHKIPKEHQREVVQSIEKEQIQRKHIDEFVAELSPKKKKVVESKPLPMLDDMIDDIIGLMGKLTIQLNKVKGHTGHIQNKRLVLTFNTAGKDLRNILDDIFPRKELLS